ncbi:MAG: insulinase family protein [Anaerolineae bacterium]|nr:MAG: insulinase family protein [Anaerolineae bacterium]
MSRPAIPGPQDITRVELPNGIVVLARANPFSPSVTISGGLMAGALNNPPDKLGLADFTASALMRGTQLRDMQAIYDTLESAGASLGFSAGTHTTGFHGKCLAEDLSMLLGLLAETLTQPAFPAAPVEKLRNQILTGLALRDDDTGDRAGMLFDELAYPDHPYSLPEEGQPWTVKAITRTDLAVFHAAHYGPRGLLLAVVGGVDPQVAAEAVAAALGNWTNPSQPEPPALPALGPHSAERRGRVPMPGKSQTDILLGAPGPARNDPQYVAAALANDVLGGFGMMGRIGESVREKAGLAYYAGSNLGGSLGPGPWSVSAGVHPKDEEQAIDLIKQEIRRLVTEPVSAEELADSQEAAIGRLPLSLETNGGVTGALLNMERHNLGLDYYQRYPEMMRAVTREDSLAAARQFLNPDALAIALAGPLEA